MNDALLQQLGLTLREGSAEPLADYEPASLLLNPVTRERIAQVTFAVMGDRLVAVEPPVLAGLPPFHLGQLARPGDLESALHSVINTAVMVLQRRMAELQVLGIPAQVDPRTLLVQAVIDAGGSSFHLESDRLGGLLITAATINGDDVPILSPLPFELSEFRDRSALVGYLHALLSDGMKAPTPVPASANRPLSLEVLSRAFGATAVLPPASALEMVVSLSVRGQPYRFAVARAMGSTFKGLLAGREGKVWSGRFELETFPGVELLAATALGVPASDVELLSGDQG